MNSIEVVKRCVDAFEKLSIPYVAVGALSVNVYSPPRLTHDADFVVQLGDMRISQVIEALGADFALEHQMSFETITATTRYRMRHKSSEFLIELFQLSDDAHDRTRFERRVRLPLDDLHAYVLTAEDLIITKLRWSRQGKRPKDRQDILNVLTAQTGHLDLNYIRSWTDQHATTELFETLFTEAERLI